MPARVAIITRTKERPLLLERAIQSVLAQRFEDWVHIIVNDGGHPSQVTDLVNLYEEQYGSRIRIIDHEKSLGMQAASNRGIAESESEFIAILDDDDAWHPDFLSACVSYLDSEDESSRYQGVAVQMERVFETIAQDLSLVELKREPYQPFESVRFADACFQNPFPPVAFLFRRSVLEKTGPFKECFDVLGDWDFLLNFLRYFEVGVVNRVLAFYYWRVETGDSHLSNSVTLSLPVHKQKLAELFNYYLKEERSEADREFGQFINQSRALGALQNEMRHQAALTPDEEDEEEEEETVPSEEYEPVHFDDFYFVRRLPRAVPFEMEFFKTELQWREVVSFDVFDTCLLRKLQAPTDLFWLMNQEAKALVGDEFHFAPSRIWCERVKRRLLEREGIADVTLDEIYECLATYYRLDTSTVEQLKQLELEYESKFLCANELIKPMVEAVVASGKQLVYTSDMYLPAECIERFLQREGFPAGKLIVSNAFRKTKHEGALFDVVLNEFQLSKPELLMHVGDNFHSDYWMAEQKGIKGIHYHDDYLPRSLYDQSCVRHMDAEKDRLSRLLNGLARVDQINRPVEDKRSFCERIGYQVAGPIYFCFLNWLIKQARLAGKSRLYFLSRDGHILSKYFKQLKEKWSIDIESDYMYASRRLFNVASIVELDEASLDFLTTPNPMLRVRDFLGRIHLSPKEFKTQLSQCGLNDLDRVITTHEGYFLNETYRNNLRLFFVSITDVILESSKQEREKLLGYLKSFDFSTEQGAIVDVGWQASSLASLQRVWETVVPEARLSGYYFGTWEAAEKLMRPNTHLHSYFAHLGQPEFAKEIIQKSVSLFEFLFSAPHGSVLGLECVNGQWKPLLSDENSRGDEASMLEMIWKGSDQFFSDILERVGPEVEGEGRHYLANVLQRVLGEPIVEEVEYLGHILHSESFGDSCKRPIVMETPSAKAMRADPSALRKAYYESNWRKGFLAKLDPVLLKAIFTK